MPAYLKILFVCPLFFTLFAIDSKSTLAESSKKPESKEPNLLSYTMKLDDNESSIPSDRRAMLVDAASGIRKALADKGSVNLVFVCTHNSRRSQFSQAWATIAADHFHLNGIRNHSCGTAATACNARTVAALERAGLKITHSGAETNPIYSVTFDADRPPFVLFSKAFDDPSLPKKDFFAMMCCDDADQNCPHIPGAIQRVPLFYVDPKVSDDRPNEAEVYDERSLQIATEMFALMKLVAN